MTKEEIINLALTRIGESPVTSLDEGSTAARTAELLYDGSRRAILRDFDWSFATKSALLVPVDTDEAPAVFAVPSDCLRALRVYDKSKPRHEKEWFKIQGDKLFTYARVPVCFYIRDEENTRLFDAKFAEALSYKLAGELAMPVRQSESLMASMLNAYQNVVATAATESANEHDPNLPTNPYVEARNA